MNRVKLTVPTSFDIPVQLSSMTYGRSDVDQRLQIWCWLATVYAALEDISRIVSYWKTGGTSALHIHVMNEQSVCNYLKLNEKNTLLLYQNVRMHLLEKDK